MGPTAVDRLLVLLLEGGGSYFTRLLALGFTEEEIGEAWDEAWKPATPRRPGWELTG